MRKLGIFVKIGALLIFQSNAFAASKDNTCTHEALYKSANLVITPCMEKLKNKNIDNKTQSEVLYLLGQAYHRTSRIEHAIKNYDEALKLQPKSVDVIVSRAWAAEFVGDIGGATRFVEEALRINPKSARAWDFAGFLKEREGDFQGALDNYTRAVEFDPIFALARLHRGKLLGIAGKTSEAVFNFTSILNIPKGKLNRGGLVTDEGKGSSFHAAAYRNRGDQYVKLRQFDLAEKDYDAAVAIEPGAEYFEVRGRYFASRPNKQLGRVDEFDFVAF